MAAKSKNLTKANMGLPAKIFFTVLFFMMGLAIMGAGLKGQEATAPIILSIGMMMNLIGLAPWYIPMIYDRYVSPKIEAHPETAIK